MINSRDMAEGWDSLEPQGKERAPNSAQQSKPRRTLLWRILFPILLLEIGCFWAARIVRERRAWESLLKDQERLAAATTKTVARRLLSYVEKKIPPRTTFSVFMQNQGVPAETVHKLIQQTRPVYDLSRVRAGNQVMLVSSEVGGLRAIRYEINQDQNLWITRRRGDFDAAIRMVPYVIKVSGVAGTVQDSLYQAVESQGENGDLAVNIADIFGWDIDFNTETRSGDRFAVVVEKKILDGQFVSYGRILAAEYTNGSRRYQAVLFHDASGRAAYYAPTGKSMQKAFLRSPLPFAARITSHFSYHRFHPILKRYMPHLGIDYAAPVGSHVQAVADGTVIFAGWDGGAGKLIKLRHSHGYETFYMHLSRILIHRGEHVHQGQIIALTGETGLATGPHLDFRIEQDGRFRNFLALNLPPAESVSHKDWDEFVQLKTRMLGQLAMLVAQPHGAEQATLRDSDAAGTGGE